MYPRANDSNPPGARVDDAGRERVDVKLTRVVHTDCRVVFGAAAELLPDVAPASSDAPSGDTCLLFVDGDGSEAHGYVMPAAALRELAQRIIEIKSWPDDPSPSIEVVRTLPSTLLGTVEPA